MTDDSNTSYYAVNSTHNAELSAFGPTNEGSGHDFQLATSFPEAFGEHQESSPEDLTMEDMFRHDFNLRIQPEMFEEDSVDQIWFSGSENDSPSFERENSRWTFEGDVPEGSEEGCPSLMSQSDDSEMSIEEQNDYYSSLQTRETICTPWNHFWNNLTIADSSFRPSERLPFLSHEIIRER